MSKLSELSNHMIRGYAGVRPPELRLHPDAKSFNMKLPIIIQDVRTLYDDSTENVLEANINDRLIKIIKQVGDNRHPCILLYHQYSFYISFSLNLNVAPK